MREREGDFRQARDEARTSLEDTRSDRTAISKRSDDRGRKLEQQRVQLNRIRIDVERMERETSKWKIAQVR